LLTQLPDRCFWAESERERGAKQAEALSSLALIDAPGKH